MSQIEREIKLLNVDVKQFIQMMKKLGVEPKGKYVQDVYTFDFPEIDEDYDKYLEELKEKGDSRGLIALINEVKACFSKEDIQIIESVLGTRDIVDYIKSSSTYEELSNEQIKNILVRAKENFSKWIRLRKTGNETTLAIKKVIDSRGEYELDAVRELEFQVPDIETGREFLISLGYFPALHQRKMRIAYDYGNTEIVIDKWPKIPPYVEVEGKAKEDICRVVALLGFKACDMRVMNTDDVYQENGLDLYAFKNLDFDEEEEKAVNEYLEYDPSKDIEDVEL